MWFDETSCINFLTDMFGNFKRQWRAFRGGKPGHRFVERHDRVKQMRKTQSWARRLIEPAAGILMLAIAVVMTFLPGPGILFYFASAGLLAGESRLLARGLDWGELRLRRVFRWIKRWWKHASLMAKLAVIFLAVCVAAGFGYAAYRIFLAK